MQEERRERADMLLAEEEDGRQGMEFCDGVEVSVGENEVGGPREADVGTGKDDGLGGGGVEEGMLELEEWCGGGKGMEGKCLLEPMWLSEHEELDSLCLFEDGGGGRRGTGVAALESSCLNCESELFWEVGSDSFSRSRESNCTTTSSTSTSCITSEPCGTSSHTELAPEASGDVGIEESLPSFCSSSALLYLFFLFSSSFLTSSPSSPSSSLSSESPKPSCARALAIFLRCCRTWARQGDPTPPLELPGDPVLLESCEPQRSLNGDPGSVEVLEDNCLQFLEPPRGFRPSRRWLITELEGLSWEAKTRVAGHLSGGKV